MQVSNAIFGTAIKNFLEQGDKESIKVFYQGFDEDIIEPAYLVREYNQWPYLEKLAIERCYGNVLEIGSLFGVHAKHLKQKKINVECCEIDPLAAKALSKEFVVHKGDAFKIDFQKKYDCILILMNGLGILESYEQAGIKLKHLLSLLNENGKIIADSSYLEFLSDENEDYPNGEVPYHMEYKSLKSANQKWLFLSLSDLNRLSEEHKFSFELLAYDEENHHYLVEITK